MNNIEIRKKELEEELRKYKLEIRPDSRLCYCYIHEKLDKTWSLDKVVFEICVTNWLWNYTDYKDRCDYVLKHMMNNFRAKTICHNYFKLYVQPNIKIDTINFMGGIPLKWPWI